MGYGSTPGSGSASLTSYAPLALFGSVSVLAPVVSRAFPPATPIIYAIGASARSTGSFPPAAVSPAYGTG